MAVDYDAIINAMTSQSPSFKDVPAPMNPTVGERAMYDKDGEGPAVGWR